MAIHNLLEEDEGNDKVGPMEQPITEVADAVQNAITEIATTAGSYLQGYMRYVRLVVTHVTEKAFQLWLLLLMPCFAWASVGEYLLFHVPFYMPTGAVGMMFFIGPPLLIGGPAYRLISNWLRPPSNVVPFPVRRPLLSKLAVQPSPAGYTFWTRWVVLGSILFTLVVEVGWLCGVIPLSGVHDTFLAWPNVWLLDRVCDGARWALALAGLHA